MVVAVVVAVAVVVGGRPKALKNFMAAPEDWKPHR